MAINSRNLFLLTIFISISFRLFSQELESANSQRDSLDNSFEKYYYLSLSSKIKGDNQSAINYLNKAIRLNPLSSEAQHELSLNYTALQDFERAILFAENAVRLDSKNLAYWVDLSNLYSYVKDYVNLERCIKKLYELDPKYKLNYCSILAQNNKYDESIALIKDEISTNKSYDINYLILLRDIYINKKDFNNSVKYSELLISKDLDNVQYKIDLSEIYIREDKLRKAKNLINDAIKLNEDNYQLNLQAFKISLLRGEKNKSKKTFESYMLDSLGGFSDKLNYLLSFVEIDSTQKESKFLISVVSKWLSSTKDSRIYSILGNLYKVNGQDLRALAVFRDGLLNGMNDQTSLTEMLFLEYENSKVEWLLEDSEKVIELHPSLAIAYYLKGFALINKSQFSESLNYLKMGVELVQNNYQLSGEFYSLIAECQYRLGDYQLAYQSYDKSLSFIPDNFLVLNNYSYYLAEKNYDLDKALGMIESVLSKFPNDANYIDTYAWVLFKKGDLDLSLKEFQKLAKDYPKDLNIGLHYSEVLIGKNQNSKALDVLNNLLEIYPSNTEIKERIEKIKK